MEEPQRWLYRLTPQMNCRRSYVALLALLVVCGLELAFRAAAAQEQLPSRNGQPPDHRGALAGHRYRVLVSTDIGGTDPDDFQSLVHLLVYADCLDIEGLVSSPYGPGRKQHLLDVIDCYEKDYAKLRSHSADYPKPESLRAITKQGEKETAPYPGVRRTTEGSQWIVTCARRDDQRPLHVLIWGGLEDLAQALSDAPDILPKLRVYYIGGPNKKWSPDAYQYLAKHHANLWIIEANSTYRGWFVGGNQTGDLGNQSFVSQHVAGRGALGDFFQRQLGGTIKMGDTPSVAWLLAGTPDDPALTGWGGQFVRGSKPPFVLLDRLPTSTDRIEVFGILEMKLPLGDDAPENPDLRLVVENQSLLGHVNIDRNVCFRFSPKEVKTFQFVLRGNVPSLDGKTGAITAVLPTPVDVKTRSAAYLYWWTDDPNPDLAEGPHLGAKTVSRWREAFLRDFAARMNRCREPAAP